MFTKSRSHPIISAFAIVTVATTTLAIASSVAFARSAPIYTSGDKLAVSGYDPVAYFTAGQPVKGQAEIATQHQGFVWRFASEANRAAFLADPARYTPQYGGYCAWAVSQGYTASADPTVWKVVEGKLYLNYNRSVGRTWEKNMPVNISRADANWPKVLDK